MIRPGQKDGRWTRASAMFVLTLALALNSSRGVAAEEKTTSAAAASAAPVEDSITAAKRDFDAVKAARNPALQQRNEVPRMSVPDLRTGTPTTGPIAPKKLGPEKKSANWLIEAMEKQQPRKDRGREGDRDKNERDTRAGIFDPSSDANDPAAPRKREESEPTVTPEEKRRDEPVNPLASYLGEWMTPQDYALLKPGLDQSLSKSGFESGGSPVTSLAPTLGGAFGNDPNAAGGTNLRGALAITPRENPYLATLGVVPAPPSSSAPVFVAPPASTTSAPPPVVAPAAMPAPAKSKIPEFAKPSHDEKYFKQLKRF